MSFSTILFTEKGRALQAKALAGATLKFTKIAMGSGSLGGQNQITLNDLIDVKVILNISEIKRNDNYAVVKGVFRNQDINAGFYWREIGLFARDPDIGEILYCYGNAGTLAEYIPPQSSEIIEKVVSISAIVGDAQNVTAIIDESLVYASKKELEQISQAVKEAKDKADQAFTQASNGKAAIKAAITGVDPNVPIPDDATFTQLANAISKIKTGVDTEDATATAEQILAGMTAYVKGIKVTGTMPKRTGADNEGTYRKGSLPGKFYLKPPKGYYDGTAEVNYTDPNLVSDNIKAGVSVLGVPGKGTVIDTAGTNVTSGAMLAGYSGYANGSRVEGSIPIANPDYADQLNTGTVSVGAYSGDGANYAYMYTGLNGKYVNGVNYIRHYEPYLRPEYILQGASIMGVAGAVTTGKKYASGIGYFDNSRVTLLISTPTKSEYTDCCFLRVSGLNFRPRVVCAFQSNGSILDALILFETPENLLATIGGLRKFNEDNTFAENVYIRHGEFSIATYSYKTGREMIWHAWE